MDNSNDEVRNETDANSINEVGRKKKWKVESRAIQVNCLEELT